MNIFSPEQLIELRGHVEQQAGFEQHSNEHQPGDIGIEKQTNSLKNELFQMFCDFINLLKTQKELFIYYMWRFAHIHVYKLVVITIACFSLSNVS